jgi:hypothetical protein
VSGLRREPTGNVRVVWSDLDPGDAARPLDRFDPQGNRKDIGQ